MNKEKLIEKAKGLYVNNSEVFQEYNGKITLMVDEMNMRMLRREDIKQLVGEENLAMMQDNHANHARFIASILNEYQEEVLVDTVLWVFRAYRSRGFTSNYWAAQLNTWIHILQEHLTEETYRKVYPIYHWMLTHIPSFVECSDEKLESNFSLH